MYIKINLAVQLSMKDHNINTHSQSLVFGCLYDGHISLLPSCYLSQVVFYHYCYFLSVTSLSSIVSNWLIIRLCRGLFRYDESLDTMKCHFYFFCDNSFYNSNNNNNDDICANIIMDLG